MVRLWLLLLIAFSFTFSGCTRNTDKNSLSFSMSSTSSSGYGAQSVDDFALGYLAINLVYPNGKRVFKSYETRKIFELIADSTSTGTALGSVIQLPDDPSVQFIPSDPANPFKGEFIIDVEGPDVVAASGVKFQLLTLDRGIEGTTEDGKERFQYAELPSIDIGGETEVVIDSFLESTTVTNKVEFGGRFLDTPTSGPSGPISYMYSPGNGSPAMKVHEGFMAKGWFTASAFDGFNLSIQLEPHALNVLNEPRVLFEDINASSTIFTVGSETYRAEFDVPAFKRAYNIFESSPESQLGGRYVMGFFTGPNNVIVQTALTGGGYEVCYHDKSIAIPEAYKGGDTDQSDRMLYVASGGTSADVRPLNGGVLKTFGNFSYAEDCLFKSNQHMAFLPQYLASGGGDGGFGMNVPFGVVDAADARQPFLRRHYDRFSQELGLEIRMLPGTEEIFSGISVLYKERSDSNDGDNYYGGGEDITCKEFAIEQGFTEFASLDPSTSNHSLNISPAEAHMNELLLCPYIEVAGVRNFIRSGIHLERIIHDDWEGDLGIGAEDFNVVGGDEFMSATIYGEYSKLIGLAQEPGMPELLRITRSNTGTDYLKEGDEILVSVHSKEGSNTCGDHFYVDNDGNPGTNEINTGYGNYYRVLYKVDSDNYVVQRKGILADIFNSGNAGHLSITPAVGTDHCGAYVTRVREFKNLIIDPTRVISANRFDYTTGGGIIALKVNGDLQFAGNGGAIEAAGRGYEADFTSSTYGGGVYGPGGGSDTVSGGSPGSSSAGGGAGAKGDGADGAGAEAGGVFVNQGPFAFGSAGGQDATPSNDPTDVANRWGTGGGVVAINARRVQVAGATNTSTIKAYGSDGTGGSGGGGGGSLILNIPEVEVLSGNQLELLAHGGDAASSTGGVGGGGQMELRTCIYNWADFLVETSIAPSAVGFLNGAGGMSFTQSHINDGCNN